MSEYQYVAFRAIDEAVDDENLAYMHTQSSRAAITPWSFENEYHFGDFHGNALEMLRRGYDVHLHYANFGIRKLLIRLPDGLPNLQAAKPYLTGESFRFRKDKKGPGGALEIQPYYEPGDLEDIWDLDSLFDRLAALRSEILDGDLRPLYVAHLAVSCDSYQDPEETVEAPVPVGLKTPTDAQLAFAEFYGISEALLAAAAEASGEAPSRVDRGAEYAEWVARQPKAKKDAWLVELLTDPGSTIRSKIQADFQKASPGRSWPTVRAGRTIAELMAQAEVIEQDRAKAQAAEAARQRASRLKKMAADPKPFLRETERLVATRSTHAYGQAAELLAELREALSDTSHAGLAEEQARKLKAKNPTRHRLTSELRSRGFVPK